MKRIKTFFAVFALLMSIVFVLWIVDSVQVSAADYVEPVTLTPQQTLALYGSTIQAQYKDGSTWKNCTFSFFSFGDFSSSAEMPITDYDLRGSQPSGYSSWSDYINNNVKTTPRLYYVCNSADANYSSPTTDELKLILSPSLDISGILYYRQNIMFTKYSSSNWRSDVYCASNVSYSASPILAYPNGWDNRESGYVESFFVGSGSQSNVNASLKWNLIDIYLNNLVDGVETEFALTGQELHYGRSGVAFIPPFDELSDTYYVLSIQCPTVSDNYIVPQPPETTPNYSSQLDSIVDIGGQNNTILRQILAKLDLIYQQMQQGESSPTLQDPETIGFDSRTKQEILEGVHGAASMLDSQNIPEGVSNVAGAVWSVSDTLLDCVPGLAGIYTFIFVLGIVSWVFYGKRGG